MGDTGDRMRSRNDWEREVEELRMQLHGAVCSLENVISNEASSRRLAAQFLTGPAYFDNPTPEIIARFRRESKESEAEAERAARAAATLRREIDTLIGRARHLGGEIEAVQVRGERALRTLRRRNFGRYTDEVKTASGAWEAERSFLTGLLAKLKDSLRMVGEHLAKLAREEKAKQARVAWSPPLPGSVPVPGGSSPRVGNTMGIGGPVVEPMRRTGVPTLPPLRK